MNTTRRTHVGATACVTTRRPPQWHRLSWFAVAAAALAALTLATGLLWAQDKSRGAPRDAEDERPPLLIVSGTGSVEVRPDEATVRLGAVAQAERASAAQQEVNRIVGDIIDAVQDAGIAEERIQTASISLGPVYEQRAPGGPPTEPRIVAYRASNTVSVRVDQLERVGPVIDSAMKAGANQLEGIAFGLKDDGPARQDALTRAAEEARAKARVLARATGVELSGIEQVSEGGSHVMAEPRRREFYAQGARAAAMPTPVQPGELTVSATVTIHYRIAETDVTGASEPPAERSGRDPDPGAKAPASPGK